ncbi:response regulator [Malaciobacter mytili]|uniref:Response regulator n=1 Tax=Malaciobacter mytili LMG 24559 TaxID=1032238 RepID=A0AAX2ALU1_9BACT|nr:response regulator [Malaciobacter mytili]AXH14135.1 two-component system response regulator [Malaciobacter mytili LMG 24559]RXI46679.1 response regulator [Malaciobacter mytili]RXK17011.1 response regulator [Malaciobacter mytili LMG 24559]
MENRVFKIAIVDDETEILNMLSRFLNRSGKYSVSTFSNPVVALNSIKTENYDVILLDIMMPQMNGLDALEKIMEIKESQKVIMMTAYSTLDKVLKSHKQGATNYVMKPFDSLQALENKIIEVLKS